jgi:hypothetical protein
VHDNQIEDRLRSVLRKEGDDLTVNITAQELERRLALRRRARANRRLSLVAAGIAMVAIGGLVIAGNGWLGSGSAVAGKPATTATAASAAPDVTSAPSMGPTPAASDTLSCTTIGPNEADQPPALLLGATPGDAMAYGGALGAYKLGTRQDGEPGTWTSIDPRALATIPAGPPTERLEALASNPDACLIEISAVAVPFGQIDATPVSLGDVAVGPTRIVDFDQPPAGEWLVRVHATFATRSGAEAWTETFFRMLVRDPGASVSPLPIALPNLPQAPGDVLADYLHRAPPPFGPTGDSGTTVAGQVPPRSQYQVDVVCLGSQPVFWSIGHQGQSGFLVAGNAPCDGTITTQSVELGTPSGDLDVVVDGDSGSAWHIQVSTVGGLPAFVPPALRLWNPSGPDGASGAAEAFGRCVSTSRGSDQCAGEWFVLDWARPVVEPPGASLTFALQDGWTIDQARVTAAVTDRVRAKPFVTEYTVGFVDTGGSKVTIAAGLGRGSWIVRVAVNATKDGQSFGAYYDLPLVIE